MIAAAGEWPPQRRADRVTYVLVAGQQRRRAAPLPIVPPADLDAFVRSGKSVVLTDDHAPVDQLLAPTFKQALRGR